MPVWAWGAIGVGVILVLRQTGSTKRQSTTLNTLLPGGGGTFAGGGGGGSGSTPISTLPGNVDSGAAPGGVSDVGLGAVVPRIESVWSPNPYGNVSGSQPGTIEAVAKTVDGIRQLPSGGIQTVGGLTIPEGLTEAQTQEALSHNMSLTDWHLYQLSQGVKGATMYGKTPDPIKAAQDAAAAAEAQKLFAAGERYAATPGYVNGVYVGVG